MEVSKKAMATIKICDRCDKRDAKAYNFFNGEFQFGGHKGEPAFDTHDLCDKCAALITVSVIKKQNLEPELCKAIKEWIRVAKEKK